jgi:hypothetical protein
MSSTMTPQDLYASKLTTAADAVAEIASGSRVAMGMALAEPPGLLTALAARAEAQAVDEVRLYYFHSTPHAATSVLRYELMDRIRPHCFFLGPIERALLARHGLRSVAADGFQAPGVVVSYTDDAEMQSSKAFLGLGLQTASGVPLQCDEGADFRTFRIGLFGLDKLGQTERAVKPLEQALQAIAQVRAEAVTPAKAA